MSNTCPTTTPGTMGTKRANRMTVEQKVVAALNIEA